VTWAVRGTLRRHAATAAPWQQTFPGLDITVDPRLDEFDHREIFYLARPDLRDPAALDHWKASATDYARTFEAAWSAALLRWMAGQHDGEYRESWPAFRARCLAGIASARDRLADGGCGLVVTSAGPLTVLLQACWQVPDRALAGVQATLHNTGWTELWPDPAHSGPGRLGQINVCAHLPESAWRTLR